MTASIASFLVDNGQQGLMIEVAAEVCRDERVVPLPKLFCECRSVRCDEQVFQIPQRGNGRQRFFFEDVEGSAAEFVIAQGLSQRRFVNQRTSADVNQAGV